MAMERKPSMMGHFMWVNLLQDYLMAKESLDGLMEVSMKGNGKITL